MAIAGYNSNEFLKNSKKCPLGWASAPRKSVRGLPFFNQIGAGTARGGTVSAAGGAMRPILALGVFLLGISSAVSEPKHPDTLVAAVDDAGSAADEPSSEQLLIDRLIGSIDLKSDVTVPTLELIEASHEQQDSADEPPPSGARYGRAARGRTPLTGSPPRCAAGCRAPIC